MQFIVSIVLERTFRFLIIAVLVLEQRNNCVIGSLIYFDIIWVYVCQRCIIDDKFKFNKNSS